MKLRALVVDDSRIMRQMIMESLKQTGLGEFDFLESGDGGDAMSKFDDKIDIVFLDWNMPNLNGIEFARHIRSMRWARHVPVVMITSESGVGSQQTAYDEARITTYVTKPFTVDAIRKKLMPIFQEMSQRKQAAAPAQGKASGGFFSKLIKGD